MIARVAPVGGRVCAGLFSKNLRQQPSACQQEVHPRVNVGCSPIVGPAFAALVDCVKVAKHLLAAAFSLRFSRMGGVGTTLSYGVASGFVLYIGTKVLSDLGGAGLISPFVAAWSPAIVGVMIGALILLYQEDG